MSADVALNLTYVAFGTVGVFVASRWLLLQLRDALGRLRTALRGLGPDTDHHPQLPVVQDVVRERQSAREWAGHADE